VGASQRHAPASPSWLVAVRTRRARPGLRARRGYVRGLGLSAAQLVHVPGAGDFQVDRIEAAAEPAALGEPAARPAPTGAAGASGAPQAMDAAGAGAAVLAAAAPGEREALVRENAPDPLAGEQTWPTEEARAHVRPRPGRGPVRHAGGGARLWPAASPVRMTGRDGMAAGHACAVK